MKHKANNNGVRRKVPSRHSLQTEGLEHWQEICDSYQMRLSDMSVGKETLYRVKANKSILNSTSLNENPQMMRSHNLLIRFRS